MTTLKEIISLAKQKPNVILNTIFLVIFFAFGYGVNTIFQNNQKKDDNITAIYIKQISDKDKEIYNYQIIIKNKDSLIDLKDKKFQDFVLAMNEEYKVKITESEKATENAKRVIKDVKRIEKSQSKIIKQLKDNE